MTDSPRSNDPTPSPHPLLAMADNLREGQQRHPMTGPSDAEKYRWIRANRGNFAIVDALGKSDRDVDFDDRIAAEMSMCAAGLRSYRLGAGHS
jgi:hypothetical protein